MSACITLQVRPIPTIVRMIDLLAPSNDPADECMSVLQQEPEAAYRAFLEAVRVRDLDCVFDALSQAYGTSLRVKAADRDFGPLFDLWCASYPALESVRITGRDTRSAILDAIFVEESRRSCATIRVVKEKGRWRVDGESFR